jgi:hypothetical protein
MGIVLFDDYGRVQPTPLPLVGLECGFGNVARYIMPVFAYLPHPVIVPSGDVTVHIGLDQRQEYHVQGAHVPYVVQVHHVVIVHQSEKGVVESCRLLPYKCSIFYNHIYHC